MDSTNDQAEQNDHSTKRLTNEQFAAQIAKARTTLNKARRGIAQVKATMEELLTRKNNNA